MGRMVVVWHGDFMSAQALIEAIGHNCDCNGKQPGVCSAHQAMLDQRFLDRILFARYLRDRLLTEEERRG
jgi:hypothetical protein